MWNYSEEVIQTDGVKPDGSDDDKVCNNTEDSEAHVQNDHQPALVMKTIATMIQHNQCDHLVHEAPWGDIEVEVVDGILIVWAHSEEMRL